MIHPYVRRSLSIFTFIIASLLLTTTASAQTFTPELTPTEVTITAGDSNGATFQAAINHDPGFASPIQVSFTNVPFGVTIGPAPQALNPPYNAITFRVTAVPSLPAATHDVTVVYNSSETKTTTLRVHVLAAPAQPSFVLSVTPDRIEARSDQAQIVTVTAKSVEGFTGIVNVTAGANAALLEVTPAAFAMNVPANGTSTQQLSIRARSGAPAGNADFLLQGTSGTVADSVPLYVNVIAAPPPDFTFAASAPNPSSIRPGESSRVIVTATPSVGFTAPITVDVQTQLTATPRTFTLAPGAMSKEVVLTAGADAGPQSVSFRATSGAIQRTASAMINVLQPPAGTLPVIDGVSPDLTTPSPDQVVYLVGRNFVPGAVVTSSTAGVVVERAIVRSPSLTEVTVRVKPGVNAGSYRLDLRNPDGNTTRDGGRLLIRNRSDLGAAVGVTTAAIVHPVEGTIIAGGEDVYARALLATTGTGSIAGYWALDGIRFDSFTASVAGGRLVGAVGRCSQSEGLTAQVCTNVPIPPLTWGASHRLELIIETPQKASSPAVTVIGSSDSATGLTVYEPVDGAEIESAPRFRWTLVPGTTGYELEFESTGEEGRVVRFRTSESHWAPRRKDLQRLGVGTFRWRVRAILLGEVRNEPTPWRSITIRASAIAMKVAELAFAGDPASMPAPSAETSNAGAPPQPSAPTANYAIAPNVAFSGGKEQDATARAQMSMQGEFGGSAMTSKLTGDVSYDGRFDPKRFVQESRNWIIEAGTPADRAGGEVRLGYTTPDFTDGAEFLTSGVARTGVIGRARSRFGTLSYYQPVSTAIHGVMSGNPENLEIRSVALATPEGRPYVVRLIGLEVEEPADAVFGTPGSRMRTLGVFGRYDVSPRLSLVGEVARGKVDAKDGGLPTRDGMAIRFGVNGTVAGMSYGVAVRGVDANFVNPANRALTAGGVTDRVSADLNLGRTFGRTSLNLTVRRQEQGRSDESTLAEADQTTLNAGLNTTLGRVAVSLSANRTSDRGEADEASFLPETRRNMSGLTASFSEMFGRFSLSQSLSVQSTKDDVNPLADQKMSSVNFSASGMLITNVTLSASLGGIRTESAPSLGTTDNWTLSLQPSIAIPFASLSLQPSVSFSRSENDVLDNETKTEGYQAMMQWSPSWLGSFVGAQLSAAWNRAVFSGTEESPMTRTYNASVTFRLNKTSGM